MDFELTEEQGMLREFSRKMLATTCPTATVRAQFAEGIDVGDKLWRQGAELGWCGLAVGESHGGSGQGLVDLCLVAEEIGRAVAPSIFVETGLVAATLAASTATLDDLVAALASGTASAVWAVGDVTLTRDDDAILIEGIAPVTHAAGSADWFLVPCTGDDEHLALVPAAQATLLPRHTLDETRRWHEVRFAGPVEPTHLLPIDAAGVQRFRDAAAVLTAADALGAAERLLEMTVDYVKVRQQFDRPIGTFQAIKHKVADMLTALRAARAAIYYAAMAWDAGAPDVGTSASVAKAFAGEELPRVAGEALQAHGGIGFTWEHDLHLYLRRIKVDGLLFGAPQEHYERVVSSLAPA